MMISEKINYDIRRKKPIPMVVDADTLFKNISQMIEMKEPFPIYGVFAVFLYLTGARVSEGLSVRKMDITREGNDYVVNLKTLKSRIKPLRKIPIVDNSHDHNFFYILDKFLKTNWDTWEDNERIFWQITSRKIVWWRFQKIKIMGTLLDVKNKKWINSEFKLFPHYLRHCRLSHLVSHFGYGEYELMSFAGWSSTKPAQFYVKLDYRDLKKKLINPDVAYKFYRWLEKYGEE